MYKNKLTKASVLAGKVLIRTAAILMITITTLVNVLMTTQAAEICPKLVRAEYKDPLRKRQFDRLVAMFRDGGNVLPAAKWLKGASNAIPVQCAERRFSDDIDMRADITYGAYAHIVLPSFPDQEVHSQEGVVLECFEYEMSRYDGEHNEITLAAVDKETLHKAHFATLDGKIVDLDETDPNLAIIGSILPQPDDSISDNRIRLGSGIATELLLPICADAQSEQDKAEKAEAARKQAEKDANDQAFRNKLEALHDQILNPDGRH